MRVNTIVYRNIAKSILNGKVMQNRVGAYYNLALDYRASLVQ